LSWERTSVTKGTNETHLERLINMKNYKTWHKTGNNTKVLTQEMNTG